jgi:hypothetical protein
MHEARRETVRKGFEQRSKRGLGRYKEGETGRKGPSQRSVGLRCRGVRGFSDRFRWGVLRSPPFTCSRKSASRILHRSPLRGARSPRIGAAGPGRAVDRGTAPQNGLERAVLQPPSGGYSAG